MAKWMLGFCVDEAWVYLLLRPSQEMQIIFTYDSLSYQPFWREWLIALISAADFKVHHLLLPPLSSHTMYTVILGGSQGCGSQSLECLMSIVYIFILLTPTQELERLCAVTWIFSNMKIVPWCLLIWSLLLSSCEVPPSTLDFHPLAKFGFPLIAQIIHFWEQEISAFWEHICHFVAGAPWELRWAINNDNTFPYLQFQSHCVMPCSGEAIQECDGSFCLRGEQASVVHHLQRGEKCQLLSIPRLGSFFSRTKTCCIHG